MRRKLLTRAASTIALVLGAALVLLPFFWMISISLKPPDEIFTRHITLLPTRIAWENYSIAVSSVPLGRFLMNGVIVCSGILFFQMLFSIPCAYALAQRQFKARVVIFGMVLAGLLVPFHVTAIPIFLGLAKLRLLDTYTALILPFATSVFGIFLFRQFFARMPKSLFDAARVDGLSEGAIVWRIALPLSWPAATAFAIFSVTAHWNDLFWPLIATSDPAIATPPLGILYFRDEEAGTDLGPLMAGALIITAPLILLFLFAQKTFIRGVATGGLRG
jgi:multiple sugar transport system permease protein